MSELTMGSLFDGIGVFPLAASRHRNCTGMGKVKSCRMQSPLQNAIFLRWYI